MSSCEITRITQLNKIPIYEITLTSNNGSKACISNYGAILMKWFVVTKNNMLRDVVLGFDTIEEYWQPSYLNNYAYLGAIIGRYANRIENATFHLLNQKIKLNNNLNQHHLHGGNVGFDKKIWKIIDQKSTPQATVTLQYISEDGEENFPGKLTTQLKISLHDNELMYEISATTLALTIVNLTQHNYFNLDDNHNTIGQQKIKINANYWLQQDVDFCTTGQILTVENSTYNFLTWKNISENKLGEKTFDQSFVINQLHNNLNLAAEALSSDELLQMQVYTNQPVVHFYDGNGLYNIKGKQNQQYYPFSGYCFETQVHPNAVNISNFPNTVLLPGELYCNQTIFKFI